MSDTDVVLWKGSIAQSLVKHAAPSSPMIQSRFFLPSQVLVGRYGVVGMLVIDSKPQHRKVTYEDGEWQGVDWRANEWELMHGDMKDYDPARLAHFVGTEQGFSIIRAFGLPSQVADVFARDSYLGEPYIAKCACDSTFDVEFDEMPAKFNWQPVQDAMPLIQTVALAGWEAAGLPHDSVKEWQQFRTWLSFHGWFAFAQAVEQGQLSVARAVHNFDSFMERFAPKLQPYPIGLVGTSSTLPDKL